MTLKDIDLFFNTYKNSIGEINRAELRLIKESYSYDKWIRMLRNKSVLIREHFITNTKLYDTVIRTVIDYPRILNTRLADRFLFHVDFFLTEGYRDYGVTVPILNALIPFYRDNKDFEHLMDSYFFKALALMQHNQFEEAEFFFDKAVNVFGKIEAIEAPYRKYRFLCAQYFRLRTLTNNCVPSEDKISYYYRTAVRGWLENIPEGFITPKKSIAIQSILNTLMAACIIRRLSAGLTINNELSSLLTTVYMNELSKGYVSTEVHIAYFKYQFSKGSISQYEYKSALLSKYNDEQSIGTHHYSFYFKDFISLFDDELADDHFDKEYLLVTNRSASYVHYLLLEILKNDPSEKMKSDIFNQIFEYYSGFTYISGNNEIDYAIWHTLETMFPMWTDTEQLLHFLRNILVHRQITTAIHSSMVGHLCKILAETIYDQNPELFNGAFKTKEDLSDFAFEAGFCHDIGKLLCSDIINLQSRRILDEEFETIKNHPINGATLLKTSPLFSRYTNLALGHHRFYDGSHGYPESFKNIASPDRFLIDIITICDCIDAATDDLGRNYTSAKDFNTLLKELTRGSGTRYNPLIVNLISSTPELTEKLARLVSEDRGLIQYNLYQEYIMPNVKFTENDERFPRTMTPADIEELKNLYSGAENIDEIISSCSIRYVLSDSKGNLFSFIMGKKQQNNLFIDFIYTPSAFRRSGCASELMKVSLGLAKKHKIHYVFLKEAATDHDNKFGWRNGFRPGLKYPEYMERPLRESPILFITSSQTVPVNEKDIHGPCTLNPANGFCDMLANYWPENARVLAITSDPDDNSILNGFTVNMSKAYEDAGFTIQNHRIERGEWNLLDATDTSLTEYDVIMLCGGHVPTQNAFFEKVKLSKKLENFTGLIISTSAGSMNLADEVYAMPELPGETGPKYQRFLKGLDLTKHKVIPHYNYLQNITVDKLNPITQIAIPDSKGHTFIALEDGSFIFKEDSKSLFCGPHKIISNGKIM